ncbi:MAG TPA: extracellular solute-binding protein [Firmicutes bacterium]|nr:extracellular solute-binding protein [Bacillota bacterium]
MKRKWTVSLLSISFVLMILGFTTIAGATELRFLAVGYPSVLVTYYNQNVVPEFERLHGVKVILENTNWDSRMDKILISIAGGVPYDIVSTGFYSVYEEGSQDLLAPLDHYLSRWELTNRFPAPVWEALKWKGHVYAVPQNHDLRAIAYNKNLFAQVGLDPNQPPQSWEELILATRRLTRMEGDRLTVRGFARSSSVGGRAQELFWFMRMLGVPEVDVETYTSNLDKPEALEALRALAEIAEAARYRNSEMAGGFALERVAMQRQHPGAFVTAIQQNPGIADSYGLFAPRRDPGSPPVTHDFINGLAILNASRNKDLAWKFITTLYEEDVLLEAQVISGFMAGRMDMMNRMMSAIHPKIGLFYDMFNYLQTSVVPPPRNTSQQVLGNLIQQVYNGELSPANALDQAHHLWSMLLEDWRATIK